jgi:3-hydroxy acid dehydrogenase / malonic semialdehyde reductase
MRRIALITGATSGIGKAAALKLAENGFDLIITGRRNDLLQQVKDDLLKVPGTKVVSICFDVRNNADVVKSIEGLSEEWKKIDVLVNNAGLASGLKPIQEGDLDDWEKMIDTNIKGLLYMTRAVAPLMVQNGKGHIINITSIAAKEVYENGNVYCGTKHAVDAITKGTRIDLLKHNIRVTSIAPGMVETEFSIVRFHGDKARADKVYDGFEPLLAEDIADALVYAVTRPPHVNISDMLIMPTAQAGAIMVHRK